MTAQRDLTYPEAFARLGRWVAVLGLLGWRLAQVGYRLGRKAARGGAAATGALVDDAPLPAVVALIVAVTGIAAVGVLAITGGAG